MKQAISTRIPRGYQLNILEIFGSENPVKAFAGLTLQNKKTGEITVIKPEELGPQETDLLREFTLKTRPVMDSYTAYKFVCDFTQKGKPYLLIIGIEKGKKKTVKIEI